MTSKYEAFVLAAETGSFKSTAEQLGYTQAGISYMMSSLESEMGTALFARDHSGVRLTEDGRNLLPWIQDVCTSERALQAAFGRSEAFGKRHGARRCIRIDRHSLAARHRR